MARAGAGLLVQVIHQISFGIAHQLSDLAESRPDFSIAPLFKRAFLAIGAKDEFCSLFGIEEVHGSVLFLTHHPQTKMGRR